jgi:acetyl esterase
VNVQRLALQAFSRLPDGILRRMAGPAFDARGVPLDPLMQIIWKAGVKQPGVYELTPAAARARLEDAAQTLQSKVPGSVSVREDLLRGPAGPMPVRVYSPGEQGDPLPVILFFHFGGYVIGSRHICDGFCGLLAERARALVINVEYRLAPEHPFPAPIEDALAAYAWVTKQVAEWGGDPNRVAVAGDSAGGQLAALIAQEAMRRGWTPPRCQVLIYPWLVPKAELPSYTEFADAYPLDTRTMEWFGKLYFGSDEDLHHPWAAPLLATDLDGLPEALIYTAGFDPLRDEGEDYAERLRRAGVTVEYRCFAHLTHSFTMLGGVLPAARDAMGEIADAMGRRLHGNT